MACRIESGSAPDLSIADQQLTVLKQDSNTMRHIEDCTCRRIDYLSESLRFAWQELQDRQTVKSKPD
ncbi:MAG: hypothetical protein KDK39_01890 [Leptospiraceae bacterium]|nr:hypothetical protein [Leptospiraceae bacterium]